MESLIFLGVVAALFVAWLLFQKLVSTTVSATTKVVARGSIVSRTSRSRARPA